MTDIARYKSDEAKDVIKNWMRSKDTIEFLGLWEKLHNNNFKGVEFDSFRNQAGSNAFTMSPTKWIETTGAIGIVCKSGPRDTTTLFLLIRLPLYMYFPKNFFVKRCYQYNIFSPGCIAISIQ